VRAVHETFFVFVKRLPCIRREELENLLGGIRVRKAELRHAVERGVVRPDDTVAPVRCKRHREKAQCQDCVTLDGVLREGSAVEVGPAHNQGDDLYALRR
jgi:hypothetical protein